MSKQNKPVTPSVPDKGKGLNPTPPPKKENFQAMNPTPPPSSSKEKK